MLTGDRTLAAMRSRTTARWSARVRWLSVLVACATLCACDFFEQHHGPFPPSPTPRGISSNAGMDGLHFSYSGWEQGLAIMFVDQIQGDITSRGGFEEGVCTEKCSIMRNNGIGYEWVLTTSDGLTADLTINGVPYELTQGALFAIQLDGDEVMVHQLDRELPLFGHGEEGLEECTAFVNDSPDLIQLVKGGSGGF